MFKMTINVQVSAQYAYNSRLILSVCLIYRLGSEGNENNDR